MEDIQTDTNILLRSSEPAQPTHKQAVEAVKKLLANGDRVCLIPQNLIEFWNVATRPIDKNGFGWTPAKTDAEISRLESLLTGLRRSVTNHLSFFFIYGLPFPRLTEGDKEFAPIVERGTKLICTVKLPKLVPNQITVSALNFCKYSTGDKLLNDSCGLR